MGTWELRVHSSFMYGNTRVNLERVKAFRFNQDGTGVHSIVYNYSGPGINRPPDTNENSFTWIMQAGSITVTIVGLERWPYVFSMDDGAIVYNQGGTSFTRVR